MLKLILFSEIQYFFSVVNKSLFRLHIILMAEIKIILFAIGRWFQKVLLNRSRTIVNYKAQLLSLLIVVGTTHYN